MKLLCLADIHLTDKKPENRIDNYQDAQYEKFAQLLHTAVSEYDVVAALVAGDFFETYNCSNNLLQRYIRLIKQFSLHFYVVAGQHDLQYHSSNISKSPLAILEAAGLITIVKNECCEVIEEGVCVYGAGWNEKIPEITNDLVSILLTHRMIIHNEKLWYEQKEFTWGHKLLRDNCFDLIVSGDNHQTFSEQKDGKTLVNPGSLMRSTTAQLNHKPSFFIYDTDTGNLVHEHLFVELSAAVFDVAKIEEKKVKADELNSFVEKLDNETEIEGLDYKANVIAYMNKNKIKKSVKNIINEVMEGV